MMNYSVILLGATISVSLYIRLCVVCSALEVNSGLDNNKKYSPYLSPSEQVQLENGIDPLAQYRENYLRVLKDAVGQRSSIGITSEDVDEYVEHRLTYLKNAPSTTKQPRVVAKHHLGDDYYDEQICGIMHPNFPNRFEEDDEVSRRRVITDGSAPKGCFFEDKDTSKETLVCNERNMRQVPKLPIKLFRLHISGTRIQEVNKTNFGDVSITNIELQQNEIMEIQPWAFSNVKNIGTLEIMDNSLAYLAFDIYFGLTDVYALHLDGNQISFEIYENCTARTNISEIPHVLPKLRLLSLNRNPLKIIPAQMWAGLRESELAMLEMARCGLEFIHEDAFTFLPKLTVLYLTANPGLMQNLVTAFKGLRNGSLEYLYLGDNGLHRFPTEALSFVSETLTALDLSGNPIAYLDKSDLPPNLARLKTLNLARCMIMEIQKGTLDLVPNLVTLDLEQNYLSKLPELAALKQLRTLILNDNIILPDPRNGENGNANRRFMIPDFGFANLTNLQFLFIMNTKVGILSRNTLTGLIKLESLLLENSELEIIDDEAFTGLESLKNLQMNNNPKLKPLNSLTFYGLQNLKNLFLAECGINFPKFPTKEEDYTTDSSTTTEITHGQIIDQPFTPDYYRPFMFLTSLGILDLSNNSITEVYPELFSENKQIFQLLLSGNKIKPWSAPLLQKNYTLRRVAAYPNQELQIKFFLSANGMNFITDAMIADMISFQAYELDLSQNAFVCDKGACALRDLMLPPNDTETDSKLTDKSKFPHLSGTFKFLNMESYTCLDPTSNTLVPIVNVTNEICAGPPTNPEETNFEDSNWTTIIIASTASFAGIITIAAVGYKQRAHIRYWIFRAQLNVSLPQSAKSRSLAELIQYDFDIFVSYHNEDRNFILDKFLPEVEDPGFRNRDSLQSNITDLELGPQKCSTGFRVCLHERDFEAGLPITDNILDSVDRSKKIVIVVSKKYLESQWCTFEMNLAYHRLVEARRNSFVIIVLEEIPANLRTKVLNYLMRSRTYLEWPGEDASPQDVARFWTRLRSSFRAEE